MTTNPSGWPTWFTTTTGFHRQQRYEMSQDECRLWDAFVNYWGVDDGLHTSGNFEKFKALVIKRRLAGDITAEHAKRALAEGMDSLVATQKHKRQRLKASLRESARDQGQSWAPPNRNLKLRLRDSAVRR